MLEIQNSTTANDFAEAMSLIGDFEPEPEKMAVHGGGRIQRPKSAPVGSNVHAKWSQRRPSAGKR